MPAILKSSKKIIGILSRIHCIAILTDWLPLAEERGYSVLFCSLDGVPIRVLFPKWLIEDKELFFSCSLEKDYRISGTLELEVSRGTGIKDYYITVHTFNSVEKRT